MDDERRSDARADSHLTRREVLRRGGSLAAAAIAPIGLGDSSTRAVVVPLAADGASAGFLGAEELACLRTLGDRFIPGPPEDLDPGAAEAGCAEAIDALLGAFNVSPPRIYAGAPFSDCGDAPTNDFLNFLPLDDYEELAWRLRIFYDEVEYRVGVQGDVNRMPAATLAQAPRSRQFVMPPNPTGYAAKLVAEGARRAGFTAHPYPAAVNAECVGP